MDIGIYTLFLFPGQIGGIETYLRQLVIALGQVDQTNRYTLFVGEHNHFLFQDITYPNLEQVRLSFNPARNPLLTRLLTRLKLIVPPVLKELQAHPVHLLHYPGTTIDQLEVETPCVLTMHDIQQEYFPQFFSSRELARRRATYKPSAQKARQIITDTEFTRQSLIEKYNVAPDKIKAIHLGIDPVFQTAADPSLLAQVRRRYRLPERFIFFPANLWPHKNHLRLFEALKIVRQKYQPDCYLVLSGVFQAQQARLKALVIEHGLQEAVQILGYVPYTDLPGLYAAAELLVFPSLFEGFGMPVIEAMACGCPVVCANTTSLPEIAGEAAILVDPYNVAEIAEAIHLALCNERLKSKLKAQGIERSRQFSWQKTAQQTVEVYRAVLTEAN